jgi:hypothetical protein
MPIHKAEIVRFLERIPDQATLRFGFSVMGIAEAIKGIHAQHVEGSLLQIHEDDLQAVLQAATLDDWTLFDKSNEVVRMHLKFGPKDADQHEQLTRILSGRISSIEIDRKNPIKKLYVESGGSNLSQMDCVGELQRACFADGLRERFRGLDIWGTLAGDYLFPTFHLRTTDSAEGVGRAVDIELDGRTGRIKLHSQWQDEFYESPEQLQRLIHAQLDQYEAAISGN